MALFCGPRDGWIFRLIALLGGVVVIGGPVRSETAKEAPFLCLTPQVTPFDRARVREAEAISERLQREDPFSFPSVGIRSDMWQHADKNVTGPVTVNIAFLDGSPQQRNWVKQYADEWIAEVRGAVVFNFDDSLRNQIRVTFASLANRSEIGNQAEDVKDPAKATMQLGGVKSLDAARNRQIILHEFGHALGLRHEHQHPDTGIKWNEKAISADFPQINIEEIRNEITKTYTRDYLCLGAEAFDEASIMMYPVPEHWTTNHKHFTPGLELSKSDKACLHARYGQRKSNKP